MLRFNDLTNRFGDNIMGVYSQSQSQSQGHDQGQGQDQDQDQDQGQVQGLGFLRVPTSFNLRLKSQDLSS